MVIPAYNDFKRLDRCLDALGNQTVRDRLEIIVSLDGGESLPGRMRAKADKIIEGRHEGPAAARNRGWKGTDGNPILFTDSDCVPDPGWAEEMLNVLTAGADAVKGVYSFGGGKIIQRLAQVEFEERYRLLSKSDTIDMIDTYSAGYRRGVLMEAGGFDETFPFPDHEDVDLSYRMAEEGYILRFAPEAKVAHTHRDTWKTYLRMKFSRGRWRMKILRRFPRKTGTDSYTPICMKIQILLCPLMLPALLLLPVNPLISVLWAAVFILTTIPLVLTAFRMDKLLVPVIPIFAFLRSCALFSGLCRGIFTSKGVNE
ncbi:MAG: glycosyltransferase [Candidatus Aegiribacteria sp.]|nr:glycosyltransferase [Candidatus Aegiribacteria sp.]